MRLLERNMNDVIIIFILQNYRLYIDYRLYCRINIGYRYNDIIYIMVYYNTLKLYIL